MNLSRRILILALNIILISILWFSKDSWFSDIEDKVKQSKITTSKEVMFVPGNEINWVINIDEKQKMGRVLDLGLTVPVGNSEPNFEISADGYLKFEDGRKLQRKLDESDFFQSSAYEKPGINSPGFKPNFPSSKTVNDKSSNYWRNGTEIVYRAGKFINVFYEPLTINVKIMNSSQELQGKIFRLKLVTESDPTIYEGIGFVRLFKDAVLSLSLVCLFLMNLLWFKVYRNKEL